MALSLLLSSRFILMSSIGMAGKAARSPLTRRALDVAASRRLRRGASLVAVSLVLASCGAFNRGEQISSNPRLVEYGEPVPKGGGIYKVGNPYKISGRTYTPREDPTYNKTGTASWYGLQFHGRRTANGEIYDMDALSAAHPTLPLPSFARVRNLRNGKEVVVRINDRGPYASDRIIDLSSRAADVLDFKRDGTTPVQVTYLGRAPLNGDDGWVTTSRRADEDRRRVAALMAGEGGAATLAPPSHATSTPAPPQQPVQVASAGPLRPGGSTPEHPQAASPQPLASPPTAYAAQPSVAQSMGALSVQAASFRDRDNAERMRTRLAALGPVGVDPVDVGGITYYRVRMGPFADSAQASSTLDRLAAAGVNGARLVPSY